MAAAAAMFAACSESEVLNEVQVPNDAQAIGFSTYSNKATRATKSEDLETYHQTFGVWAYKTYEGNESVVMPNYVVKHNDNGEGSHDWDYDGTTGKANGQSLKYWDKRASYKFYAYAPYSSDVVEIDANKVITIKDGTYAANQNIQEKWETTLNPNTFTGIGKSSNSQSTDWMIANPISRTVGEVDLVEEQFSHIMSKLIVCVKTTDSFKDKIKLNSIQVGNVYGSGSYASNYRWTTSGSPKIVNGCTGEVVAGSTFYSMEYLLIPSTAAPTFSVNYTINGDTYDVKNQTIAAVNKVDPGTVYIVTVTISADPIHFDAAVTDWSVSQPQGSVTIQ